MQFQSGPGHLILANAHTNTLEPLFGVFMSDWDMHCLCRIARDCSLITPTSFNSSCQRVCTKRMHATRRAAPDDP